LLSGTMWEQDPVVLNAMKEEVDYITKHYRMKIGYTEVTLTSDNDYCKLRECSLGNMIADAFVDYVSSNYQPENGEPVVIGLVNSDSIQGSLPADTVITLEDVVGVLPLNNKLEVLELTGSELKNILEMAMENFEQKNVYGNLIRKTDLIQVSGLKIKYNARKGRMLESVKVAPYYMDLNNIAVYNVVMPESITKGQRYTFLNDKKRVVTMKDEDTDVTVVRKFIEKQGVFRKHEKYSGPERRISIPLYTNRNKLRTKRQNFSARHNVMNGRFG
jgi:2',3'-cyclic-nucleotide 2'-phosphodiesterase (5'-nucleotidase family)